LHGDFPQIESYQHGRLKAILKLSGQISELPERVAGTIAVFALPVSWTRI